MFARDSMSVIPLAIAVVLFAFSAPVAAQEAADLAKQAQNPIGNLISVPFQNNFNGGFGPEEKLFYNLDIHASRGEVVGFTTAGWVDHAAARRQGLRWRRGRRCLGSCSTEPPFPMRSSGLDVRAPTI